jgi:hypothetical protein
MEIPGGTEELLGLSGTGDVQVSGKLAEVRASNGLKGNRGLFDNLELAKKLFGDLILKAIQINYSEGKIERITGKKPTPEFFSPQLDEYDCVIKQTVKTQTQREAYYYQLLQLIGLGAPIPWDEVLENAPMQGHTRLLEKMAEEREQQKQAVELEMQDRARMNALVAAQTDQNISLAQERRARVLSDVGLARERESEAEQNRAKALLDNAKTVVEMKKLGTDSMLDVVRLSMEMHQLGNEHANQTLHQDVTFMETLKRDSKAEAMPQQNNDQLAGLMGGQQPGGPNG